MVNPDDKSERAPTLFDQVQTERDRKEGDEEEAALWPPQERFPLNEEERSVGPVVSESYQSSNTYTIVTAFTSLEHLLSFFSQHEIDDQTVDIVLGNEPSAEQASLYADAQPIEEQARAYWLQRGVSVLAGGGAVRLIEAIDRGQVRFYAAENLHAKMYVGEDAALFGSSNFSRQGLHQQREANGRFEQGTRRYREIRQIAHQFREEARECTDEIRRLIEDLLQPVQWEEALARAAAEILEGDWIDRYPRTFRLIQEQDLWPHQEQAIAQGLWILDTRGGILVADATGSGKTRVGTHLLYGLLNRLWSKGQAHRTDATVVCPPNVTRNWTGEIERSPASSIRAISHGKLSQGTDVERVHHKVRTSNVLFLDEAHNYLNRTSKRSKAVTSSAADYTALLTATPINRGAGDLLRMIELLGLDNLSEPEFETYKSLRTKTSYTAEDEQNLRSIVGRFTIRRTKQDLNRLVERRPEGYTTDDGTVHRFPEHISETYATGETEHDKRLARQINQRADDLRGLRWLRTFKPPFWIRGDKQKEKDFLEQRIKGATGLANHTIRAALQSSKAALLEVIYGTEEAARHIGLDAGRKDKSGDYLRRIQDLRTDPPADNSTLSIPLPDWLTSDLEETIQKEKEALEDIGTWAQKLSNARAEARAEKIRDIAGQDPVLLAFGARPLTLHALHEQLSILSIGPEIVVADGNLPAGKKREITQRLGLEGNRQGTLRGGEGLIALCSDAMSEGLNLQRAGSVVLLDTPSVIRIAEQRVGRIDRMDSPHEEIEVWWPDDSAPFQSRRRDLLIERYNLNERLMGNNIELPEAIGGDADMFAEEVNALASTGLLIEEYEEYQESGSQHRLDDAFRPVRELVGIAGPTERQEPPLVESDVYESIAGTDATVWSRITIMESKRPWAFFCVRGRDGRAPRWVLLHQNSKHRRGDSSSEDLGLGDQDWKVQTRLDLVAKRLRALLPQARRAENLKDPTVWAAVTEELDTMLKRLRNHERELLSNKAQHALELLEEILYHYEKDARRESERRRVCRFLRNAVAVGEEPRADLHDLADEWLGVLQPRYVEWKQARRPGRAPIRLKDMQEPLLRDPLDTDTLQAVAQSVRWKEPIGRRLAAAIVALLPVGER